MLVPEMSRLCDTCREAWNRPSFPSAPWSSCCDGWSVGSSTAAVLHVLYKVQVPRRVGGGPPSRCRLWKMGGRIASSLSSSSSASETQAIVLLSSHSPHLYRLSPRGGTGWVGAVKIRGRDFTFSAPMPLTLCISVRCPVFFLSSLC